MEATLKKIEDAEKDLNEAKIAGDREMVIDSQPTPDFKQRNTKKTPLIILCSIILCR
jgi:hypothetical protein